MIIWSNNIMTLFVEAPDSKLDHFHFLEATGFLR